MRNLVLVTTVLVLGGMVLAQPGPQSGTADSQVARSSPSGAQLGSPAIWRPGPDFPNNAHAACDNAPQPPAFAECFINQMARAGASQDAVAFTRKLYQTTGQVGIVGEFKTFDLLGLAWVVYPLRANDNDGVLVLNGDPSIIDVDDLQKLDKTALEKDPLFLEWKKSAPKLDVWPGDRSGGAAQIQFARTWPGAKPGGQRFLFSYPLIDGCHACTRVGFANYWWDFDAKGKFLGTQLLSVTRGAPPVVRHRPAPPPAQTPSGPKSSPPGTIPLPPSGPPSQPQ